MKRIKTEEDNRPKKKLLRLIRVGVILFMAVFVLEVWMVNRLSTYGTKIEQLQQAKASLELQNQVLENEIAQKSSLNMVEQKAHALGFDTAKNLDYYTPEALASANN